MIGAALADSHLGFRAYTAIAHGRNVREQDVERAWYRCIAQIGALGGHLDLLTIAGDVFHRPNVSDFAKQAYLTGIRDILRRCPNARVVVLQGNHDAGKTAAVLSPIQLAAGMDERLYIVEVPTLVSFETARGELVSVRCLPFFVGERATVTKLEPDPRADVNALLIHAAIRAPGIPEVYADERALSGPALAEAFDVVLAGDYHAAHALHPERLAFYSGSIERTSSNVWADGERGEKGWIWYDTARGARRLEAQRLRPLRTFKTEDGAGAVGVNAAMAKMAETENVAGAIVRLIAEGFPREERALVDQRLYRKLQALALHFRLDLRYAGGDLFTDPTGERPERRTLGDLARAYMADAPGPVRDLALAYYAEAAE